MNGKGENDNLDEATKADVRRMTESLLDQTTIEQLSRAGMAAKHKRELLQENSRRNRHLAEQKAKAAQVVDEREMNVNKPEVEHLAMTSIGDGEGGPGDHHFNKTNHTAASVEVVSGQHAQNGDVSKADFAEDHSENNQG